jgi:POT family proton-dependent oligopeptide transporter
VGLRRAWCLCGSLFGVSIPHYQHRVSNNLADTSSITGLSYNQLNNNLVAQAGTTTTNGIPNDVISNLNPFTLIIGIPICDLLIYPALRRAGIRFTAIKKICFGFFTGAGGMVWAAVLQHYIYKTHPCGKMASECVDDDGNALVSPLSVWTQSGAYVLVALSEILASITGLEYAFTKAPKNMRSLVMAVFLFTSGISSALGQAFVALSADPLLVWNYTVVAILAATAGTLFWISHRHLDKQEEELNNLAEGRFGEDADVHPAMHSIPTNSEKPGPALAAGPVEMRI